MASSTGAGAGAGGPLFFLFVLFLIPQIKF